MYCSAIFNELNYISNQKFVGAYSIRINDEKGANSFVGLNLGYMQCYKPSYDIAIILSKNEFNSIGDSVNPKFIKYCKDITVYSLNMLSMNWACYSKKDEISNYEVIVIYDEELTDDEEVIDDEVKISNEVKILNEDKISDDGKISFKRKEDRQGLVHKFLRDISYILDIYNKNETCSIEDLCDINRRSSGIAVHGKIEEINSLFDCFKKEAIHSYYPLHLLMCAKNDKDWLEESGFIKEIFDIITKMYIEDFMSVSAIFH